MVTESNNSNRFVPPYIINLLNRDNTSEGTIDILHYFTTEGFIRYLTDISMAFNDLGIPENDEISQVYVIAQRDFEAIKIGITKNPKNRMISLQTGNPCQLLILFHYDPIQYYAGALIDNFKNLDVYGYEHELYSWLTGDKGNERLGEWLKPDDRCFRILLRAGIDVLRSPRERQNKFSFRVIVMGRHNSGTSEILGERIS